MSTSSDAEATDPAGSEAGSPPRRLIIVATGLAVLLAVAIAIMGLTAGSQKGDGTAGPLTLPAVPAPDAKSRQCTELLRALPKKLESGNRTLRRRELTEPAPPGTVAWGGVGNRQPVVLRCGVRRPAELARTSRLQVVNGVRWLPVDGRSATSYYVVDRGVFIALTVPAKVGTGAIQAVSDAVAATLERDPLEF